MAPGEWPNGSRHCRTLQTDANTQLAAQSGVPGCHCQYRWPPEDVHKQFERGTRLALTVPAPNCRTSAGALPLHPENHTAVPAVTEVRAQSRRVQIAG